MTITFEDRSGRFIKQWPNVEYAAHGIPQRGDYVILHWGDKNEDAEECLVLYRIFDGARVDNITVVVDRVREVCYGQ